MTSGSNSHMIPSHQSVKQGYNGLSRYIAKKLEVQKEKGTLLSSVYLGLIIDQDLGG